MLEFVVVRHGTKQQRQLHLRQVAEVLRRAAVGRRTDADGGVVGAQAGIANPSVMDDLVRHLSVYKVDPAAVRRDLI